MYYTQNANKKTSLYKSKDWGPSFLSRFGRPRRIFFWFAHEAKLKKPENKKPSKALPQAHVNDM